MLQPYTLRQELVQNSIVCHSQSRSISKRSLENTWTRFGICRRVGFHHRCSVTVGDESTYGALLFLCQTSDSRRIMHGNNLGSAEYAVSYIHALQWVFVRQQVDNGCFCLLPGVNG
jgi:hypothetical protein